MTPAPPPPPPPTKLPDFSVNKISSKSSSLPNPSVLLKSIEKGTKLKKTVTNDRSAPLISSQQNPTAPKNGTQNVPISSSKEIHGNSEGLAGLFANGFPTLRSTKQTAEAKDRLKPKADFGAVPKINHAKEAISRSKEKVLGKSSSAKHSEIQITRKENPTKDSVDRQEKPETWHFSITNENELPNPRKWMGSKKIYISKMSKECDEISKMTVGAAITENDIKKFTKTLKSKLNKAAGEENFEECIRLKEKLKSFEIIEKRIRSGEQVSAAELPK